jgi:menaquinone-dependent protoporphyrinogen oxidase
MMMQVLIAVASKHGSTREIADAIAEEMQAAGLRVDVQDVTAVANLEGYDAVILGSALYMGGWLPQARAWAARHAERLATLPVWLFSSGPLEDGLPEPAIPPRGLDALMQLTHVREHRIFAGKLDQPRLGFGERVITRLVHAPDGDFRDWAAIQGWAREIAGSLAVGAAR